MSRIKKYNLDYDNSFLQIEHYTKHPQMLPYVGANYDKNKILIISESHYVPKNFSSELDLESWYNNPTDELISGMKGNTNTRSVINNFFIKKGHRLFSNLNTALKNANPDLSLQNVAWYNFYQRPAQHKKELKTPNILDKETALNVFESILEVLQPSIVIFVSKNAFECLQKGKGGKKDRKWNSIFRAHQYKDYEVPIFAVSHPNSPWWNTKHGKHNETGREHFERIIK